MELWEEEAGLGFQVTVGTLCGGDWTEGAREGRVVVGNGCCWQEDVLLWLHWAFWGATV